MNKSIIIAILVILISYTLTADQLFENEDSFNSKSVSEKKLKNNFVQLQKIPLSPGIIWEPRGMQIYKDKIFIFNHEGIVSISKEGKLIDSHFQEGNGPGEFIRLRGIDISDGFIYCVDQDKLAVSKFDTDLNNIWEKKLPSEISKQIFPLKIAVSQDLITVSGCSMRTDNFIVYQMDEDLNIINKYLKVSKEFKGNKMKAMFKSLFSTWNDIDCDNENIYVGLALSKNLLFRIDTNSKEKNFKIVLEGERYVGNDMKMVENKGGGMEAIDFAYSRSIKLYGNYLITQEQSGGQTKEDEDIELPPNYYNNLSFYTKSGEYLFSFQDKSIPYSYFGYHFAVENIQDSNCTFYILTWEDVNLYKYELDLQN